MAVREIKYTVYPSGISPQTVQRGGLQGEHNACKVIFAFSDELVTKLQKEITEDTKLYYRFDVYDGAGGYNPYETSELSLANGMALVHELDQTITVAGGNVKVYLIISKLNGDIESEMIMYTYPAELGFEKTSNGTEEYTVRDMNAAAVVAKKAAEAAEAAKRASALSEGNAEKYADEIKALTNEALKAAEAAEAVKGFVEDIDESLSYKANKDDLRCKVRRFVGITTTPIYNSMVGNTIVLLDGSTYVAEQGDVVFGSSEPQNYIENGDINKDGYVDDDDKENVLNYMLGLAPYAPSYDLNGDGSCEASDYALAKLMVAAGYSYFIYDGEEWRDYTVIADIHYKPDSINPQSGIAVEQAIDTIINNTVMLKYLTYNIANNEVAITKCDTSISGNHIIPDKIDGYPVTSIGEGAFKSCKSLTSVTIPNSVTTIGNNAFDTCLSLTNITIPNSVISIGSYAFKYCISLKNITIPNGVTSIEDFTFYNCTSLRSVTIPDSITNIGERIFQNCGNLNEIYYCGTEEQWGNITIGTGNNVLNNATIHYNQSFEALKQYIDETFLGGSW